MVVFLFDHFVVWINYHHPRTGKQKCQSNTNELLWLGSLGTETKMFFKWNKFQLCDRERREDGSHKNRYVKVVMTPKQRNVKLTKIESFAEHVSTGTDRKIWIKWREPATMYCVSRFCIKWRLITTRVSWFFVIFSPTRYWKFDPGIPQKSFQVNFTARKMKHFSWKKWSP